MQPSIHIWPARTLYLGPALDAELHRHHAVQLTIAVGTQIDLMQDSGEWQPHWAMVIPPDQPHALRGEGLMASLYLDAESLDYAMIESQIPELASGPCSCGRLPDRLTERIAAACAVAPDCSDADVIAGGIVDALVGGIRQPRELDERVGKVRDIIDADLFRQHRLDELAERVHLSPDRLQHLFRSQIGIPPRRYAIWSRMNAALRARIAGANLTEAAHAGGFTDSAHFSRRFREMFGLSPSELFATGTSLTIRGCDLNQ